MARTTNYMTRESIRGVVLDLDGVIIDSHPAHRSAWKSFLEGLGKSTSDGDLDFILDGRKREEILRHFLGELTPQQVADYGSRKDELLRMRVSEIRPIPGAVEFLKGLNRRGVPVALATSAGRQRAHGTLDEMGLARYFDAIVTGDEVPIGKPDPAIYRLAADRLKRAPEELLAVEDAVSGVKSATAAGFRCVGLADPNRASLLRAAGACTVIPDFREFSIDQLAMA
jgi:beta-phosphoglucomutase